MEDDPEREKHEYRIGVGHTWEERQQFYGSVGQAISFWASLESKLIEVAAILLGTTEHKTGVMLYSVMSFHAWLNIIEELFALESLFGEHKAAWASASANLRQLNDIRVRVAHHTVWDHGSTPEPALRPARHDARAKSKKHEPLGRKAIQDFSQDVLAVEKKFNVLILAMRTTQAK
jgi:hypothetical protein